MKEATKNVEKTLFIHEKRICEILMKEPDLGVFGMVNIYNNMYPEDKLTVSAMATFIKRLQNLGYLQK